ncbi:MAG: DsbA family protein [Pseudomonadota bacterium]
MDELSSNSSRRLDVRLLGDLACPWTHLTLATLVRALGSSINLEWHPFLLRPKERVLPGSEAALMAARHAAELDVPFATASLTAPIDSRLTHGVVLAAETAKRVEIARRLFDAHFREARPLVEAEDVAAALGEVADGKTVAALIAAGTDAAQVVERADRAARIAGVNAVPLTVIDGAYAIAGLQPEPAFAALVELALTERRLSGEQHDR